MNYSGLRWLHSGWLGEVGDSVSLKAPCASIQHTPCPSPAGTSPCSLGCSQHWGCGTALS